VMGVAGLVECFGRFALKGHRTPTPIAPPENLVVSGIYRHVRNPMYVVVVCAIVGAGIALRQCRASGVRGSRVAPVSCVRAGL
jgi:protein-S-isoprenylcysteine O-methyltransferase Ste14